MKNLVKCYLWSIGFLCGSNLDTLKSRSEIPGKFLNAVLEKAGEEHLGRLCKK